MAKSEALTQLDELTEKYEKATHATLNASPGVRIARQLVDELTEVRALVDDIEENGGGG